MASILVECFCGEKFDVDPQLAGGTIDCTNCSVELPVPSQEWSERYRSEIDKTRSEHEAARLAAYKTIGQLGTASALPALMRGIHDESRSVVNTCLRSLMTITPGGHRQLLELLKNGALKASRLGAMIREEKFKDGADILCDWIDSAALAQNQIAEVVPLIGEFKRPRGLSTLKALRTVYPNLLVLIDEALSGYSGMEGEDVDTIPDAAKKMRSGSVERVQQMAESQRTAKRSGCFGMMLLLLSPAIAGLAWVVLHICE